jgi:hypothetical protein
MGITIRKRNYMDVMFNYGSSMGLWSILEKSADSDYYEKLIKNCFPSKNNVTNLLFFEKIYFGCYCCLLSLFNGCCYMINPLSLFHIACRLEIIFMKKNIYLDDNAKYFKEYYEMIL